MVGPRPERRSILRRPSRRPPEIRRQLQTQLGCLTKRPAGAVRRRLCGSFATAFGRLSHGPAALSVGAGRQAPCEHPQQSPDLVEDPALAVWTSTAWPRSSIATALGQRVSYWLLCPNDGTIPRSGRIRLVSPVSAGSCLAASGKCPMRGAFCDGSRDAIANSGASRLGHLGEEGRSPASAGGLSDPCPPSSFRAFGSTFDASPKVPRRATWELTEAPWRSLESADSEAPEFPTGDVRIVDAWTIVWWRVRGGDHRSRGVRWPWHGRYPGRVGSASVGWGAMLRTLVARVSAAPDARRKLWLQLRSRSGVSRVSFQRLSRVATPIAVWSGSEGLTTHPPWRRCA